MARAQKGAEQLLAAAGLGEPAITQVVQSIVEANDSEIARAAGPAGFSRPAQAIAEPPVSAPPVSAPEPVEEPPSEDEASAAEDSEEAPPPAPPVTPSPAAEQPGADEDGEPDAER